MLSGREKEGCGKVTALNLGLNRAICVPGLVTLQKTSRVNCPAPHHKQVLWFTSASAMSCIFLVITWSTSTQPKERKRILSIFCCMSENRKSTAYSSSDTNFSIAFLTSNRVPLNSNQSCRKFINYILGYFRITTL